MKKKGISIYLMQILFALIPLVTGAVLLTVIAVNQLSKNMENEVYSRLQVSAMGSAKYFEYDVIRGNINADEESLAYVDLFSKNGLELTIFDKDERIITSLKNPDGTRNIGTKAPAGVWDVVKTDNTYQTGNVEIGGKKFFVFYMPIYDADGNVWGMSFAGQPMATLQAAQKKAVGTSVIAATLVVIVFSIAAFMVAGLVATPIKTLADASGELATGNIAYTFEAKSHVREILSLISSTHNLQKSLADAIGMVKSSAETLSGAVVEVDEKTGSNVDNVSQINVAINEVAETSQSVAESAQNIAEKAVRLGEDVERLNDNVEILKNASNEIKLANSDASKYMDTVLKSSDESVTAVTEISSKIDATNEAVKAISETVKMIDEIASETQLLSLNASIEAARAGEAGRGFAVVAESIKQLAESSSANASKINDIVQKVTSISGETVEVAEKVKDIINAERGYIAETQGKFEVLSNAVNDSVNGIEAISGTSAELETIKNELTGATSDLGAISEELGASAEEVSASCQTVTGACTDTQAQTEEMRGINENLTEAVAYFKI
ncbi:MAG: cache domain-containing protein [Lachnospiraceae bacterium]|nr:cache domain-containing protein [Lachnospiraceae bacterium]